MREFCLIPTPDRRPRRTANRRISVRELKLVAEQGYIGAYVPETYSGQGYGFTTYFVILEELSKMGNPASMVMGAHDLAILPLLYWGPRSRKEIPGAVLRKSHRVRAVTDPAGLNNYPEWGMTVTEDGDEFVINEPRSGHQRSCRRH